MSNRTLAYFEMRVAKTPEGKHVYTSQSIGGVPNDERKSAAEFAERACNAHDPLVTALKAARDRLTFANKHIDCAEEIAAANAALTAAGVPL